MFEWILAQATPPTTSDVISAIQGWMQVGTSAGFAGLTWFLIVKAMPAVQKRFDDHSDRMQAAYQVEMQAARETFRAELSAARTSHQATISAILDRHEKQLDRVYAERSKA